MGNIFKAGVTAIKDPTNPPNPLKPFTSIKSTDPKAATDSTSGQLDPYQIGYDSLAAQLALAGPQYDAEAKYGPKYVDLNNQLLRQSLYGNSTFDAQGYLAANPALQAAWNEDPGYKNLYGTIENYAKADWQGNSNDQKFMKNDGSGLYGLLPDMTNAIGESNAQANTLQRTADLADAEKLGGTAYDLYKKYNPALFAAQGAMADLAGQDPASVTLNPLTMNRSVRDVNGRDVTARETGAGALGDTLYQQAQGELAAGGRLTGQEARQIEQRTLELANRQGNARGTGALADTVLNLDSARRARLNEARTFATSVQGADLGRRQANDALATTVADANAGRDLQAQTSNQGADLAQQQTDLNTQLQNNQLTLQGAQANDYFRSSAMNRLAQSLAGASATSYDPFQGVLGRSSINQGTNAGLLGSAQTATDNGPQLFNPFSSDILSLYAGNQANAAAANSANANSSAANKSALIGGGASIAAAAIIAI